MITWYLYSLYTNFGCFFESFFWVSAFAVPSLLYRVDAVRSDCCIEVVLSYPWLTRMCACLLCMQINSSQLGWLLSSDVLVLASFVGLSWLNSDLD